MKETSQGLLVLPAPTRGRDCPDLCLSLDFPILAAGQIAVSLLLSVHALFAPTFFFRGLPGDRDEGAKAKRKHSERLSRSGCPERRRGRPKSGVSKQGSGTVWEGVWELPGSGWSTVKRPSPPFPRAKVNVDNNVPTPQEKFGLGLELKFKTDRDRSEGTLRPRSAAQGRALTRSGGSTGEAAASWSAASALRGL
jgi:hypothetical protein